MEKHTQGKWEFKKWGGEQWPEKRWSVSANNHAICISPRYNTEGEESEANAKLIAASPMLLEALKECRDTLIMLTLLDKSDTTKKCIAIAETAIKQATE